MIIARLAPSILDLVRDDNLLPELQRRGVSEAAIEELAPTTLFRVVLDAKYADGPQLLLFVEFVAFLLVMCCYARLTTFDAPRRCSSGSRLSSQTRSRMLGASLAMIIDGSFTSSMTLAMASKTWACRRIASEADSPPIRSVNCTTAAAKRSPSAFFRRYPRANSSKSIDTSQAAI